VHIVRLGWGGGFNGKRYATTGYILDRKLVWATVDGIVRSQLPVPIREGTRVAGVIEFNSGVVFLETNCVETEILIAVAIHTGAKASLNDHIGDKVLGFVGGKSLAAGERLTAGTRGFFAGGSRFFST